MLLKIYRKINGHTMIQFTNLSFKANEDHLENPKFTAKQTHTQNIKLWVTKITDVERRYTRNDAVK